MPTLSEIIDEGFALTLLCGFDKALDPSADNPYEPRTVEHQAFEVGARKAGTIAIALSDGRIGQARKNWLAEAFRLYRKNHEQHLSNLLYGDAFRNWRANASEAELAAHGLALRLHISVREMKRRERAAA